MSRATWVAKLLALTEKAEKAVSSKDLEAQMKVRQELRDLMQNPEVPSEVLQVAKTFKEDLSAAIIDGSIKNIQARSEELRRLSSTLSEITADVQHIRQFAVTAAARIADGVQQAMLAWQEFQKIENQLKAQLNTPEEVETLEKLQAVFHSLRKTQELVQNFKKEVLDKGKTDAPSKS
ncbi:MAG: hypothetical protein RMJ87_00410 [Cytophagales bacterium]|nr:hypothetical protein [Bernardetiaceae bacterium]MDW8203462.1 hypothetical protein [Cytophagales bacterium]